MAGDTFVDIPEISGDCAVDGYIGQHDATSYSWGVSQNASFQAQSGGATGTSNVGDFNFTIPAGTKADPNLAKFCSLGTHIPKVVVTMCRSSGGALVKYFQYTLENVIISSYSVGGSDGMGTVSCSLNFAKYKLNQYAQKDDGTELAGPEAEYDARAKK